MSLKVGLKRLPTNKPCGAYLSLRQDWRGLEDQGQ
jgi:hypothetical protein